MTRWALAPAKVNLFLHVGALSDQGWSMVPGRQRTHHPLSSLVAFADIGDRLKAEPCRWLEVNCVGPFAAEAPDGETNLVLRAARAIAGAPRLSFLLEKNIPAQAGLGGGSADAGACFRLLRELRFKSPAHALMLALELGSDVPACSLSHPLVISGRGEGFLHWPEFAPLPAVLAWPGEGLSTAAVYRAYDEAGAPGADDQPEWRLLRSPEAAAEFLKTCRNDLEAPAIGLQPLIGDVLDALCGEPETLLARMSGSGSACFALCRTPEAAWALAERLAGRYPGWWVRACTLGEPPLWGDEA
ncbi:MAG TPA: 4-(cytidine 5'-diphospho)-2-C-methyl-D-erythritol kinase [Caulobacteraceae bacterium]